MNELYFRNCKNGLLCHASWWFSLNSLTHQYELINLASVRFDPFFIIGNLITRHYNPHSVKNNLTVTWPASGCSFLSGSSREAFSCPTQCYSKKIPIPFERKLWSDARTHIRSRCLFIIMWTMQTAHLWHVHVTLTASY
jgi:hypothetical protein